MTLLAISVSLIYYYVKKKHVFSKSLTEIQLNHEKNILMAKLEMQESTFHHVSREIHDNISLSLCLVKLQLTTLDFKILDNTKDQVTWSLNLLSESIDNLNALSKGLNSELIANMGLIAAVEQEVERIRALKKVEVSFQVYGDAIFLETSMEIVLFRIVQEGLNNIIKHSQASQACLTLTYGDKMLVIDIIDNGIGIPSLDTVQVRSNKAGLLNMRSRASSYNGSMKFIPTTTGTNLQFIIPTTHGTTDIKNQSITDR